jgi:hypothetical protein
MNYSVTQTSNYAALAGMVVVVLKYFGIDFPAESIVVIIAGLMTFAGLITSIINRYQKGDIDLAGKKV